MSNEFYLEISDPSQQRYGSRWGGYFRYKIATATKRMHVNRKVRFDSTRAAVRSSILGFFGREETGKLPDHEQLYSY